MGNLFALQPADEDIDFNIRHENVFEDDFKPEGPITNTKLIELLDEYIEKLENKTYTASEFLRVFSFYLSHKADGQP